MAITVTLPIEDNIAYSSEDVSTNVTLGELLESIKEAIAAYGEDSVVVLDNGQRYGARYGAIRPASSGHEWFDDGSEQDESGGTGW